MRGQGRAQMQAPRDAVLLISMKMQWRRWTAICQARTMISSIKELHVYIETKITCDIRPSRGCKEPLDCNGTSDAMIDNNKDQGDARLNRKIS